VLITHYLSIIKKRTRIAPRRRCSREVVSDAARLLIERPTALDSSVIMAFPLNGSVVLKLISGGIV